MAEEQTEQHDAPRTPEQMLQEQLEHQSSAAYDAGRVLGTTANRHELAGALHVTGGVLYNAERFLPRVVHLKSESAHQFRRTVALLRRRHDYHRGNLGLTRATVVFSNC